MTSQPEYQLSAPDKSRVGSVYLDLSRRVGFGDFPICLLDANKLTVWLPFDLNGSESIWSHPIAN